jgi:hypothetical protein
LLRELAGRELGDDTLGPKKPVDLIGYRNFRASGKLRDTSSQQAF